MEELRSLNNFNGMMEVLSGLNSAAVRRMKKTFGGIGSDYRKKLKSIEDLLSHQFSYRAYRFLLLLLLLLLLWLTFESQGAFAHNCTPLYSIHGSLFDRFDFYSRWKPKFY